MEPFLNIGINLAVWQSVGKSQCFMERLHSSEIGFARIFARSFKKFPERLSISAALSVFISFSNCSTRSSVTVENLNLDGSKPKVS